MNNNPINSIDPFGLFEKSPEYEPYEPKKPEVETPKGPKTDTPKGPKTEVDKTKAPKKSPKVEPKGGTKNGPKGGGQGALLILLEKAIEAAGEQWEGYLDEKGNLDNAKLKAKGWKFFMVMAIQNSDIPKLREAKNTGETPDRDANEIIRCQARFDQLDH